MHIARNIGIFHLGLLLRSMNFILVYNIFVELQQVSRTECDELWTKLIVHYICILWLYIWFPFLRVSYVYALLTLDDTRGLYLFLAV